MDARALNRMVTLQAPPTGQDAIGQPTGDWTELVSVWANVRYLSGTEMLKADSPSSVAKASIRIRRRADVTAAMRVVLGATVFQILAVLPDERDKQFCDLACEVVA
jgi:SPP1 family predicted phage head-tail adaptor